MLNLWSSCNRARAVWSCFSLLPKPAQLQAHRWWNMCMIFVGESPHMNTPVTCELRHHLCGCNMGSFPVCFWSWVIYGSGKTKTAHTPVAKAPQIQHVRRILNMHSPVLHGKRWLRCARYINASCAMYFGPGGQSTWRNYCFLRLALSPLSRNCPSPTSLWAPGSCLGATWKGPVAPFVDTVADHLHQDENLERGKPTGLIFHQPGLDHRQSHFQTWIKLQGCQTLLHRLQPVNCKW